MLNPGESAYCELLKIRNGRNEAFKQNAHLNTLERFDKSPDVPSALKETVTEDVFQTSCAHCGGFRVLQSCHIIEQPQRKKD